jgi:hypothetical protein
MSGLSAIMAFVSAFLAVRAARIWLSSAKVETPAEFNIYVSRPGMLGVMGDPLGGKYVGNGYSEELVDLAKKLVEQSSLSADAAQWAGRSAYAATIAAGLQGIVSLIETFGK